MFFCFCDSSKETCRKSNLHIALICPNILFFDYKNHENRHLATGAIPSQMFFLRTSGCGIGQKTSLGNSLYFP